MSNVDPVPTPHEALKRIDSRVLTCALGVWLTVVTALALQIDNPWWGAMAAYRVSVRTQDAAEYMRRNRFLGTLVGCIAGYILAGLIVEDHAIVVVVTFFLAAVGTYKRFVAGAAYGWILFAVSALLIINAALFGTGDTLVFAFQRVLETFVAVAAVALVERCFLPYSPIHRYHTAPDFTDDERREFAIVGLAAGCTVLVLTLVWLRFDLPQPLAVLMTTLAVYNTSVSTQKAKSFQRFSGVIAGGGAGLVVAALSIESFLIWSVIFMLFIAAFSAYANSGRPDSYFGVQAGYGFIVATVTGNGPVASIMPALDRIIGVSFGVVVAYIVLTSIHALLGKEPS